MNTDDDDTLKNTFQFSHDTNPRVIESGAGTNNPTFFNCGTQPTEVSANTAMRPPTIRDQISESS